MTTSFILFGIIYFSAIIFEAWYSAKNNLGLYEYKDSMVNLFIGILVVITRLLFDFVRVQFWVYISQFALFKIGNSITIWVLLFFCNEFVYYWYHRFSHHNRILWAVHVNHHSSTRLNLLTSARLPIFSLILQAFFWLPLVLVGFDPYMIFIVFQIGLAITTFQHLRILPKIPKLDYLFNTAGAHEIHHASNAEYINHNFGLALSVFDRIFGTFKLRDENIPILIGITKNINTYNPIKVIFHEWIDIFKDTYRKLFLKST